MAEYSTINQLKEFFRSHKPNTVKQLRLKRIVDAGKDDNYLENYLDEDKDLRIILNDLLASSDGD